MQHLCSPQNETNLESAFTTTAYTDGNTAAVPPHPITVKYRICAGRAHAPRAVGWGDFQGHRGVTPFRATPGRYGRPGRHKDQLLHARSVASLRGDESVTSRTSLSDTRGLLTVTDWPAEAGIEAGI